MTKLFRVLMFVLIANVAYGQRINSTKYHIHRNDLKNSFLKFQHQKKGRVAFLGGSITHNPGWRDSVCNYLEERFPETEFDFIAAGIPSMGSTPAAFRFARDVLQHGTVDLLFEEAAVNDAGNGRKADEMIRAMEGIVRHARNANSKCDIVIMHFVDPEKMDVYRQGKTPMVIEQHEKVASYYAISTINLAKEVTERIDAGEFDWKNDFKNLHPSPFGQGVYARSIIQFLEDEFGKRFVGNEMSQLPHPTPIDKFCYANGKLISPNPDKIIKGWEMVKNWHPAEGQQTRPNYTNVPMLVGQYPGEIIKFGFKGNTVGIAVSAGADAGIIEYSIDGEPWKKQDLYTKWSKSLYLPWYYTLASGLKDKKHTLQIRVSDEKNAESTGNKCVLRYFYIDAK